MYGKQNQKHEDAKKFIVEKLGWWLTHIWICTGEDNHNIRRSKSKNFAWKSGSSRMTIFDKL